jgi:hypothetical protein
MTAYQLYLKSGKQQKVRGGYDSHVAFGQKFPGDKEM